MSGAALKYQDPMLERMNNRRRALIVSESDVSSGCAAELLKREGVVMLPGVLDAYLCERALYGISRLREEIPVCISEPEHRSDLPLLYGGHIAQMFQIAMSSLMPILDNVLGGNPELTELSCMISYPGAKRQSPHPDVRHAEGVAAMYSVFMPLADQTMEMGPLLTWPKTHLKFPGELKMSDVVPMIGDRGSMVIMNSRLFHCGGRNSADKPRPVFYFTLMGPGEIPLGSTCSIRPEFSGMHVDELRGL